MILIPFCGKGFHPRQRQTNTGTLEKISSFHEQYFLFIVGTSRDLITK